MPVLAVSGQLFMGVAIGGAIVLLLVLLRAERRYDAEDDARARREHEPR